MRNSGIYCIRNTVDGRCYVGSAVWIEKRWGIHKTLLRQGKHHSGFLQRSWSSHDSAAFSFEILEIVLDRLTLTVREQFWIDHLQAFDRTRGFNVRVVADSQLGTKRSEESRRRMSEAALRRDPATHKNRSKPIVPAWNKGKKMSFEYCRIMSEARAGKKRKPLSPETRAKIGARHKGRPSPFKGKPRDPDIIRRSVETKARKRDESRHTKNL